MGIAGLYHQLDQLNLILINKIYLLPLLCFFCPGRKEGCSTLTLMCHTCAGCSLLDLLILWWMFFLCITVIPIEVPNKIKYLVGMHRIHSRSNPWCKGLGVWIARERCLQVEWSVGKYKWLGQGHTSSCKRDRNRAIVLHPEGETLIHIFSQHIYLLSLLPLN